MSNTYYEVIGFINGEAEMLYGSFVRQDCVSELDAERDAWKADGYKRLKIVSHQTTDLPDPEVYKDEVVSKKELFLQQAPSFSFELDEDQLLEKALETGYVTAVDGAKDQYLINQDY